MIDERHEELAALHALDLLEGAELAAFEADVARDPSLANLVRALRDAGATLAHAAPAATPPAALRDRILASVSVLPAVGPAPAVVLRPPPALFRSLLPWAAAAGFAVCAAWLGQLYLSGRATAGLLRDAAALTEISLKSTQQQLEAERILARRQIAAAEQQATDARGQLASLGQRVADLTARLKAEGDLANLKITALASLLKNSPQALAVAVWNPAKQEGVLKVEKLPALALDQDYQLWVVDPQYPNPVDGGVFIVDPATGDARISFKSKQPVASVAAFAVTLERKGGVPKAEGPFVLLGK